MARRGPPLVLGSLVVGAFIACSSYKGDEGAAAADAGPDSAVDVDIIDHATTDGSSDSGVLPFSCSRVDAAFCDDFDHDGAIDLRWSAILAPADGGETITGDFVAFDDVVVEAL